MLMLGNGRLITRDDTRPYLENGAVVMEGDRILAVGDLETLRQRYPQAEWLDAGGGVIMPAFVNMHEHGYSAMARGMSIKGYNPSGFLALLDGLWWTLDRNLNHEASYYSALVTMVDGIKNGVTTVFDHHASFGQIPGSLFAVERAALETGMRACLCYEVSDRDGAEKRDQSIAENVDFLRHVKETGQTQIAGMMGMHASFTLRDETLDRCAAAMPSGVGAHIHVAEGIEDLHDCLQKHGKRLMDRLMDHGLLGPKTLCGHCIYINDHEIDLLRETDTMVVHNPGSNMSNACGCPPVLRMTQRGVMTGLGTDGFTHDMLESYKTAQCLHKHELHDSRVGGELADMLFCHNPEMANRYFSTPLGKLKEGYSADVIVLDYDPYTPMDAGNLNGHIQFGMTGSKVTTTIGAGRVLMQNRVLVGLDEAKINADARQCAKALWTRINA